MTPGEQLFPADWPLELRAHVLQVEMDAEGVKPKAPIRNLHAYREAAIGEYLSARVFRAGGTPLLAATARVLGSCFGYEGSVHVSTEHLRHRTADRGVIAGRRWAGLKERDGVRLGVSAGSIRNLLELLVQLGEATYGKAHVRRWHGDLPKDPEEWPRLRPRYKPSKGRMDLPARRITLTGFAASLFLFLGLTAAPAPGKHLLEPGVDTAVRTGSREVLPWEKYKTPGTPPLLVTSKEASGAEERPSAARPSATEGRAPPGNAWRQAWRRILD